MADCWSAEELARMRSPGAGALVEADGRSFMMLLDMCHFLVDHITQEHGFKDVNEASELRATNTPASAKLTASMYTYWDSAPAGPGVYQMLRDWTTDNIKQVKLKGGGPQGGGSQGAAAGMARVLHLLAENEVQYWPRQRVTGAFYFAKEAEGGAALLVDERRTVYRVVGISTSVGDMLRAGGCADADLCGSALKLTLLPFLGKIVYDGTLRGAPPRGDPGSRQQLLHDVNTAITANTVLTTLPTPTTAPLTGKRVLIKGLAARPELNGTHGSALTYSDARGRYGVRLADGTDVALKPANLEAAKDQSADGSRGAVSAAASAGGAAAALSAVEARVRGALQSLPLQAGEGGGFWTFRRMGYSEADNPSHQVVLISGEGMPVEIEDGNPTMGCRALQPSADEILGALERAARRAGAKPKNVAVDERSIIARLQLVLGPTGIFCGYYPPPSEEELANMGGPAASHRAFAPR